MPDESTPQTGRPEDATPADPSSAPGPAGAAGEPPVADPTAAPADQTAVLPDPVAPPADPAAGVSPRADTAEPSPASAGQPAPPGPRPPAGPPPIVPPLNPWQAPGGTFPTAYTPPVPPGQGPPDSALPDSAPPGSVPPGSVPPGSVPPGSVPPGSVPPGSVPPDGFAGGGFPPPPGSAWPRPPQQRTFTAGLIAAIAVFAVVLLGCIGAVSAVVVHSGDSTSADPGDGRGYPLFPTGGPTLPGTDDDNGGATQGPHAVTDAIKDINDLAGVCDQNAFYPKAPKYQGKAPHPIAIMIRDRRDMEARINETVYDPGYSTSKARADAWNVYFHPSKAQLTACVDLVGSGSKIKTCKFDDPKPDSLPLKVGTYQLTLFETATRKQLYATKISGDDHTCPTVVLLGSDRNLYTGITDHAYVSALKKFVEK